jgi:hypothetical protein
MTTTFDVLTVTNSIAALSITGVTVCDADQIPEALGLEFAVLAPIPDNFITNLVVTRSELTGQNLDVNYDLNYRYYHCAIGGATGGIFSVYPAMVTNLAAIVKAFALDDSLTGAMDNGFPTIGHIGPVADAAGNQYHGCDVTIHILQFLEV